MSANPWILALHLLSLFFWVGHLLVLTRMLGFHMQQPPEVQQRLSPLERRLYMFATVPSGVLVLITGLLMLHGVGSPQQFTPGEALSNYLSPRTPDAEPSFWYVTFHVKLVTFVMLVVCDIWLGRQIQRLAKGRLDAAGWPLGIALGLPCAMVTLLPTWLLLSMLGIGPSRQIGFALAAVAGVAGFLGGRKLAALPGRARFSAMHGAVAALVLIVIMLIIAKPLSYGPPGM
jgi:uncharacterized membrane protein